MLGNGEDGAVLARQAMLAQPDMRIIVMSGNAARHAESDLAWPLLEKPFSVDRLIGQLEAVPAVAA